VRELTLAKKLLWITVGSTFLTVLVLSGVLWWQMSSNSEALAKESEDYIVAEVEQKLNANAAAYGEKIAGFINEAYRIPNSLAALLGDAANTQTLNRDTVVSINRSILEKNRDLENSSLNLGLFLALPMSPFKNTTLIIHAIVSNKIRAFKAPTKPSSVRSKPPKKKPTPFNAFFRAR